MFLGVAKQLLGKLLGSDVKEPSLSFKNQIQDTTGFEGVTEIETRTALLRKGPAGRRWNTKRGEQGSGAASRYPFGVRGKFREARRTIAASVNNDPVLTCPVLPQTLHTHGPGLRVTTAMPNS